MKRVLSLMLCLALVAALLPAIGVSNPPEVAAANYEEANGKVNNTSYTLGAGTDAQTTVTCDWRSTSMSPTGTMTPKYIAIHCTGSYPATSTAKANHNYGKTSTNSCWHYTVGEQIYQMLADNRQGWHVGTSYTGAPSNSNSIGIEIAVDAFPATETFGGEKWTDGDAIMEWWRTKFNDYMKRAAYLTITLCKRHNLDWRTRVKMHWDSKSYDGGAAGKDCPMQMRATYDPATNTFKRAGEYSDGRNGYFWQMFWRYLEAYDRGDNFVGDETVAAKVGTYRITPSDGLNVRAEANASATLLGTLEMGEIAEVTELASNGWGKVTLKDGTVGWCAITQYGEYIGIDAQAYEVNAVSSGISYSYGTDGGLTVTNTGGEQGQIDLNLPLKIGTATTPYMSLQVNPLSGNGYYFGITQKGSGYWMMRDCNSSDQLVNETSAPYMTNMETLEINVAEWWKPTDKQQIDQVRFYLAPNSSIKINYLYFAASAGKVIDARYNLESASSNVTLMQPDKIAIGDLSKAGSYKYTNGMLIVTADTDAGFDVVFNLNETFDVNKLKRFLVGIEAATSFNVTLTLTNKNGSGNLSLAADYCYDFTDTFPANGYIPGPFEGTRGLDLYNYFHYNDIIPADGMSTITKLTISLGSKGTSYFNSVQISENDRIMIFRDGVVKEGFNDPSSDDDKIVIESNTYTLREDGIAGGVAIGTDIASMLGNIRSDYTVTVYENGVAVSGTALAKTGQVIKVLNGTTELASYEVAVSGDVNGDGIKNTSDARVILGSLTGTDLTGVYAVAADLEGSGKVESSSARIILTDMIV